MTKFLNISTDNTLGGNSPADDVVSSQKAVKDYIDSQAGASTLSGLTDTTISSPSDGQVLTYDNNTSKWVNAAVPTELPSITGNADKILAVNSGATGVEWTTVSSGDALYVEKTYSELSAMVTGGTLVKGQKYRITDYATTTATDSTAAAGHVFDLVVTAIDTNKLDSQAQAVLHSGDTYFSTAGANLSKWQVWYDINNDTTKYAWAKSAANGGKGVIYRLIDEWGNDCPYDFKNILFTITGKTANAYTFNVYTNSACSDHSLNGAYCYGNVMKPYYSAYSPGIQNLNFNVFYNSSATSGCYYNNFGDYCYSNTFGDSCIYNNFGDYCFSNTFGDSCSSNTFRNFCFSNTFGNSCQVNTFGNNYSSNTFGNSCSSNTFGNGCSNNIFGYFCQSNTFGHGCNHIVFGNSSTPSVGGTYCRYNIVENGNRYIRLYQTSGTAGNNNQLQNVYIAQGVNNTTTWYDISTITRNLSYRTTVAMNKAGTDRIIYCEDEITDMLPSMTNNAGKVLAVNSGATGVEWITNSGGGDTVTGKTVTLGTTGAAVIQVNGVDSGSVSLPSGSTSAAGIVQLTDSTSSTSTTTAATPNSVKSAYDLAAGAIPKSTGTTGGDIIYFTGASTPTRLAKGTAGQVLTMNSGATAPEWQTPSGGGGLTNYNFTHTSNASASSTVTVTFAANTRGTRMITVTANINVTFAVNNLSDNYLWIKNNGSSTVNVTLAGITSTAVTVNTIYTPTDGISIDAGKLCEIGIVVNSDGAFITSRSDLSVLS